MNAGPDDMNAGPSGGPRAVSRRVFVEVSGALAGMLALGALPSLAPDAALLRPPGASDEARFLSLCVKCDRCRSVCPTSAIAPCTLEDGFISARTPKLNFKLGECSFCGTCGQVCPTGALGSYETEEITFEGGRYLSPDLSIGLAVVNESRCLAWVDAGGCTICSRACPYGAVSLDVHERPVVDGQLCNGCGICENICPSSQWRSYLGGDARGIEVKPVSEKEASR